MKKNEIGSDPEFDAAVAGGPAFVLFYSPWCPFCSSFLPAWDKLAGEGAGRFLKASVDNLPLAEDRFSVEVVPTVLYFSGGKSPARLDGALGRGLNEKQLRDFAERCAGGGQP